jgi:Domain of unknown function (DUF5060)/Protein of unknown function (DUF4038)/Domain of unknown function (DUF5605)
MIRLPAFFIALLLTVTQVSAQEKLPPSQPPNAVEQWDVFEISLKGPDNGNPFTEVEFAADFRQGGRTVSVPGFYDGGGVYRVRFMPETTGGWRYQTRSNRPALDGKTGAFTATAPSAKNHGPVQVRDTFHFAYADGSPFWEIGTTCYAWIHQTPELEKQTLKTLATAPFNKLRMCVFPKWFVYNHTEPRLYPFEGTPPKQWDFKRFNPAFFQHLEKQVAALGKLGIEADVILFHPYDGQGVPDAHWGFDRMGAENDDRYLRYVVARLAAYRNVWWSLANEFDAVQSKTPADWERLGKLAASSDPYGHLRSIHNMRAPYDASQPWVTHVSLQRHDMTLGVSLLKKYNKPVIYDECQYEGDIKESWGKLTAEQMVQRFWLTAVEGLYCGHGETYRDPQDLIWWAKGGVLHGRSPARIAFLKKVMEAAPVAAAPLKQENVWGIEGEYYLAYYSEAPTAPQTIALAGSTSFKAEILDTWDMTITPIPGVFAGHAEIPLPSKPYLAIRLTRSAHQ